MALPPRKKKPAPFEDLLGDEPMAEDEGDEFEEDYSEDEGLDEFEDELPMDDPLAAEGDMMGIDPEQAALAETLGFTEPDQQQALIDLIKLVAAPAPAPMEGMEGF